MQYVTIALRGEKTMLMEIKALHRSSKSVVTLVIDPDTGTRYVRKELQEPHPVYEQLTSFFLDRTLLAI